MNTINLSERFRTFATNECAGTSNLYEFLSLMIAKDEEILELAVEARKGQPVPNLLFGAVHYLLLAGMAHPLRRFYPNISVEPVRVEEVFSLFQGFLPEI